MSRWAAERDRYWYVCLNADLLATTADVHRGLIEPDWGGDGQEMEAWAFDVRFIHTARSDAAKGDWRPAWVDFCAACIRHSEDGYAECRALQDEAETRNWGAA